MPTGLCGVDHNSYLERQRGTERLAMERTEAEVARRGARAEEAEVTQRLSFSTPACEIKRLI